MEEDYSDLYSVQDIWDSKKINGKEYFLVKWEGYSPDENTWEPIENLENIRWMVDNFLENKYKVGKMIKNQHASHNQDKTKFKCKTTK